MKYVGRTESHEQLFLHATWEQQTKESMVVGGTSCCVNLECLKTVPSAAKVMGTAFWDAEGCILAEFLEPGQTFNAARYAQTLHKFRRGLRDKRPGRNINIVNPTAIKTEVKKFNYSTARKKK
jgi:hypothetical protein